MVELSTKRVDQILHEETQKTETLPTILRGIYTRYMHLYEQYFADIDALNEEKIAELRKYHEETKSLVKYYYLDIPEDICENIEEFDKLTTAKLLGYKWHEVLFDDYEEYKDGYECDEESERSLKAKYSKEKLKDFYDAIGAVLRDGFGTGSKNHEKVIDSLKDMFFKE